MILQSMKDEAGEFIKPVPFVLEPDDYNGIIDGDVREYARQYIDPYMGKPLRGTMRSIPTNLKTPEELAKLDKVNNFIRRVNVIAGALRENFFRWKGNYIGKGDTLRYSFTDKDFFVVSEEEIQAPSAPAPHKEECKQEVTMKFPDTMDGLRKALFPLSDRGCNFSKYDFGKFSISLPSSIPSIERSTKVVERYHLFAIARALIARKWGKNYPTDVVIGNTLASLNRNTRMKPFLDVMTEAGKPIEMPDLYRIYLDSTVNRTSKRFKEFTGQQWDIGLFIVELSENRHIKLRKIKKSK